MNSQNNNNNNTAPGNSILRPHETEKQPIYTLASASWKNAILTVACGAALATSSQAATIFGGVDPLYLTEFKTDPTAYELGTYFNSSLAGDVIGLRVYLGPQEAANVGGTLTGRLWDASGTQLASADFVNPVAGWNEVAITAVSIISGDTYVVSANTYAVNAAYANNKGLPGTAEGDAPPFTTNGYFGGANPTSNFTNGPLTGTSGRFADGAPGTFPTGTFPGNNGGSSYFRDVNFQAVPEPSSIMLGAIGIIGMGVFSRRRK